jgi:hypothetical protein
MRLWTTISNGSEASKVKHYVGLPPTLTGGKDTRRVLGNAHFLMIEEKQDGIFLYRYGADGGIVGDTWHANVDDAKHQASYEFGISSKEWAEVPGELEDITALVRLL